MRHDPLVRRRIAVLLVFSAVPVTIASCSACSSPQSAADAAPDHAPDIATIDAMNDGGTEADASAIDACAPLLPDKTCLMPSTVANCDGGWCRIPHGCFIMGAPPCEFYRGLYSEDQVQTTLTHDFEIQQTEFTQAEWTALGLLNPSAQHTDAGDAGFTCADYGDGLGPTFPVGNVTLEEAMTVANLLSLNHAPALSPCYSLSNCVGVAGLGMACASHSLTSATAYECEGYRLPTEAEWEYAARAGTSTALYSGDLVHTLACGADPNMQSIGWYCFNANCFSQPVAQKQPNAWGLYDMSGNVVEWTSSQYTGGGYGTGPLIDPMPDLGKSQLVERGGLANYNVTVCRSACRSIYGNFGDHGPLGGFRLVRTLSWPDAGAPDAGDQ